ncbi:MAG: c-type cytochrome [Myxococcales bacterium]|nr:c-type cytochrome [Myxococcales bacterium]
MNTRRRKVVSLGSLILVLLAGISLLAAAKPPAANVARGAYLVKSGGCGDCHTPFKMGPNGPVPDLALNLAGHPANLVMPPVPKLPEGPWMTVVSATNTAWAGPWGVSFTANLTLDKDTGMGAWTEKNFLDTIREGRVMGKGRPLLPPMPVVPMQNLTDSDLKAIFAYLKTIPAIGNRVPEPVSPKGMEEK